MKKWLGKNKNELLLVFKIILLWRIFLFIPQFLANFSVPKMYEFLGPIPWANFDGVHYLGISAFGYGAYQYPFFPFYPLVIRFFALIFSGNYIWSSLFVSYISLFIGLFLFYKLVRIDNSKNTAKWSLLWLLFFPTSFFFISSYTESLFIMLMFAGFYLARKGKFVSASVIAAMAAATKTIGIFMVIPLLVEFYLYSKSKKMNLKERIYSIVPILIIPFTGLFSYMYYLYSVHRDALLFIHDQPNFGAGRTGGEIILLPQVVYRYIKIFLTVPILTHDFLIALLEFVIFFSVLVAIIYNFRKIRLSYLVFSFIAIVAPTLTGTLSSEPRYVLVAFPFFILLASSDRLKMKIPLFLIFSLILVILTIYFLQGYFIA